MYDESGGYPSRGTGDGHASRPNGRERFDSARRSAPSEGRRTHVGRTNAGSPRDFVGGAGSGYGRNRVREGSASATGRQAAARPMPHPSARSGGRPPSHSGRIPPQARGARHALSAGAAARPHRADGGARGRRGEEFSAPAQTPYQDRDRYLRISQKPQRRGRRLAGVLASLAVVAAVAFGVFMFVQSLPANVTLNGASLEVHGGKTLADALSASGIKPQPGDLLAVDGSVLEAGKGEPFHATVNGEQVTDPNTKLASGDVVEIGNGAPLEEPSDSVEAAIPWTIERGGNGAIHLIDGEGKDGVKATKTGKTSGITAEQVVQEPSNIVCRNVTPNVGDDKVIALTFDDGPWGDQTGKVLDILAEHDAKATFFTVGDRIERDGGADYVKRAAAEGHQVCTHSYDHASGSGQGVNLGYMTPDEQKAEIEKGYAAIKAATGAEVSRIIRTPGGNFGDDVLQNIGPLIKAEIGWNIDSGDWRKPGADAIASELMGAWSGAVVLLHDGGGDRSQTVEALKQALPRLKEQGYRFVTIDELLQYPME